MKLIFKLILLPVFLVFRFLTLICWMLAGLSSYIVAFAFLIVFALGVYCAVTAQWMDVAILTGLGFVVYLILSVLTLIQELVEQWTDKMAGFLWS